MADGAENTGVKRRLRANGAAAQLAALSPRDEADLEWYFSAGTVAFERSTFGATLERADMFSVARLYHCEQRPVYDAAGHCIGHERAISARPTAEVRQHGGYTPNSETLQRYAYVSTLLKRVAAQERVSALVLEHIYGDLGQRWAVNELYGRLGALFHLTARGKSLLDDVRKQSQLDVDDVHRMEVLCTVQRVQPNPERGQALAYCAAQAEVMAQRARGTWLRVKQGKAA